MRKNVSFFRLAGGVLLFVSLFACKKIDGRIDEKIESHRDGEIQSVVFVPACSDGKVYVKYNVEEDGSFAPEEMALHFEILPAVIADKLATNWESSLSLETIYTETKAVVTGNDATVSILGVLSSDGKLAITASAGALDEQFYNGELAASVRLVVNFDGVKKSSEYVPVAPRNKGKKPVIIDIPDIYFKAYLIDNYDTDGDGEISVDEALAVKEINIPSSRLPIRSLSGIENFTNLESLDCSGNRLVELNLKSNVALRNLNCSNNSLTELDLSDKLYLTDVDCSGNSINTLNLLNARGLRGLNCVDNNIKEIGFQSNPFISEVECFDNPLEVLNIDNCIELDTLTLSGENMNALNGTEITFTGYNSAGTFNFSSSNLPFTSFRFTDSESVATLVLNGDFTDVDVSGNAKLAKVVCPSREWLYRVYVKNDASTKFVDTAGQPVFWGSEVEIDGKVWSGYNAGASLDYLYGETCDFETAQTVCPEGWRTPGRNDLISLASNYSEVCELNGVSGLWFSGSVQYSSSAPAIFLPFQPGQTEGNYWSSDESFEGFASRLVFQGTEKVGSYSVSKSASASVRCIKNIGD